MASTFIHGATSLFKNKITFSIAASIAWLFLTFYPWQEWIAELSVPRFIIGFLLFLIPGIFTFLLVTDSRSGWSSWALGGFVLSIFGTGILGILSRSMTLNFTFIHAGFAVWGVLAIVLFIWRGIKLDFRFDKFTWWEIMALVAAIAGAVFFASHARPPLIHDDAFTYNAFLYYYQYADELDFIFPDSLNRLEIPRFWIAYWPLVEALISELSKVDGLIIAGLFLPPTLACLSFLGIYTLGRTLGLPHVGAAAAVLAQGLSLMRLTRFNRPGHYFFQLLTEDKVVAAFVVSLVLFIFAVEYFKAPSRKKFVLVGLAGLAMVFTHPVQFGMACMILGVYGIPLLFNKEIRWNYAALIGILVMVVLIPYSFRFSGGEYQQSLSFSMIDVAENDEFARLGVRRIDVIEGTPFYGISRYLTEGLPYEVGLVASVVSLFFFWKNDIARFILSGFLVLGVSMLPYTGWLVGFFTTPFQLWRLTWLMPFGLAFSFLAWVGIEILQRRIKFIERWIQWLQPVVYGVLCAALVAGIVYIRPWTVGNLAPTNLNLVDIYSNYISMGKFMNDMNVDSPIIIGGPDAVTNAIIPSLTLKFVPLVFRVESGGEQTQLWKSLMVENLSPEERFSRLEENKIEYLLLRGDPDWMSELLSNYPDDISLLFADRRLKLYRVSQ